MRIQISENHRQILEELDRLLDEAERGACPECGADLEMVWTCGICGIDRNRRRAFPEPHRFSLIRQMEKIGADKSA